MPDFGVQVSMMRYDKDGQLIHEDEAAINEVNSEEGANRQQVSTIHQSYEASSKPLQSSFR
jgi:hypothetical protein